MTDYIHHWCRKENSCRGDLVGFYSISYCFSWFAFIIVVPFETVFYYIAQADVNSQLSWICHQSAGITSVFLVYNSALYEGWRKAKTKRVLSLPKESEFIDNWLYVWEVFEMNSDT